MKKIFILFTLVGTFLMSSCTENQSAKKFGGTQIIELPKGEMLIEATWKDDNLWYLSAKMSENYVPLTKTFKEKSSYGMMEGTIIFKESR